MCINIIVHDYRIHNHQAALHRLMSEAHARLNVPLNQAELQLHSQLQDQEHSSGANHILKAKTARAHTRVVDYRDDLRLVGEELASAAIAKLKEDPLAFSMFDSF